MTPAETIAKARDIAKGSSCFLMPVGGTYKICRRVGARVIPLGSRTDASQALSLLRRLCNH